MSIIFDFLLVCFDLASVTGMLNLAFASQVAREALCNDLFVIPRAVCVGEALAKKSFPSFRIRCGDFRDPGSERTSPERTKTLVVLNIAVSGSVIVLQNWVMESWSCLACAQSFAGTGFYEKGLPCFIVSVIRMLGVLGPQNLKPPKDNQKLVLRTCALTRLMKGFFLEIFVWEIRHFKLRLPNFLGKAFFLPERPIPYCNSTKMSFNTETQFATAIAKCYGEASDVFVCFGENRQQNAAECEK